MTDKCTTCGKTYSITCDWNQGRCPNHPPYFNPHSMRFYNLLKSIKNLFKKD